jgi:16S rRNA (cytidine1402-2'-O)-methyltransferase
LPGALYVVATPIGNLEDITLRALRVLSEVKTVAAEDTRAAQVLFGRHGIQGAKLVSYFEGNEAERGAQLLALLSEGHDVALISEAGMPGVSDPGQRLIARAVEAGVTVTVVPGASAVVTALVASGLPTDAFYFAGFPPREAGARAERFGALRRLDATLVFYEAPGRTGQTLSDLAASLGGGRRACVARELTKLHEELVRGTLDELAARFGETPPRGEVTLVVEGAREVEPTIDLEAEVRRRVAAGEGAKEIAAALSLVTGKPRRQIYQLALAVKRQP